ncbi:cell surface protein SprA [Leadbetterella byssophila]|uniref:T9SS outer membrane translocon Sov/SprA n=1 Tax=Leadbetterella byssophila TaxID=316068 RepID=UPI0039A0A61F
MRRRVPCYLILILLGACFSSAAQKTDSTRSKIPAFYNWTDVYLNRFSYNRPPLFNLNPNQLSTNVLFNPQVGNFSVTEKAGKNVDVKIPEALTFNEYSSIQNAMLRKSIIRDIERAQDGYTDYTGKRIRPLLESNKIFDKIFGDKLPEFKPNGFIQVMAYHHRLRNDNPTSLYNRDRSYFDFDQQIAVNFNNFFNKQNLPNTEQISREIMSDGRLQDINNLMKKPGEIKEKVNIQGNFDTKSIFTFDNRMKINFRNDPEDILQAVELGNISFPNRSQLIPGVENLLGAKVGLKFGKLDITGVVAQQNSKTKSIVLNNGSQNRNFEIRADNYEENRHFFLAQFFRDNYERSLKSLPIITSGVMITRVEVYVTNRTYSVETNRNILALSDLAENAPFGNTVNPNPEYSTADNRANNLNDNVIKNNGFSRNIDQISSSASALGLTLGRDFEILRGAKRLQESDFEFNKDLGYISLRTPLRNDEVIAVAYEYTYRNPRTNKSETYRVGELTEDYVNRSESDAIVLKMLKSSNIRNHLNHPMWNLMMKNIYNLGQGQLKQDGFQMRIVYKDDDSGMDVPFLADIPSLKEVPLLSLLGLDRLNYNNEAITSRQIGDGNFDFIEGVTVHSRLGRIIFPVLEPFGDHLRSKIENEGGNYVQKYVFDDLYDKTLTDAQQNTLKNKFFLSGTFLSGGADIPLPLGASPSSVRVYAGGTELKMGVDYTVDQQMGTVQLVNRSLLNSGKAIRVDYEEADMFQTQIRRMFGLRMDYTVNRNLRIGATLQDLRENTPGFTTRTSIGNEPVNNTIWGLDLNYKKTGIGLTKLLDALPGVQTKEPSSVLLNAEFAQLIPGVNSKKVNNSSMIDDFEYARNINDLSRQPNRWRLGSTPPQFLKDITPDPTQDLAYQYHYRRAKMSVYTVDMTTYFSGQGGAGIIPPNLSNEARTNPFTANFNIQDILVGRSMPTFAEQIPTSILDISYFPSEPGMYNYNTNLKPDGTLNTNPRSNFGSVMRGITFDADFDNSNVEYLEFWMMNPFAGEIPLSQPVTNTTGGKLLIQLGDVSEDVIPDGRFNFENGIRPDSLNGSAANRPYIKTPWGKAPDIQFMVDAFENDEKIRKLQDVGLDGLSNEEEREYVNPNAPNSRGIKGYLEEVRKKVTNLAALQKILDDPSKDDFRHFLDPSFDNGATFIERYKDYLGMENNSPYNKDQANADIIYANTNSIDKEDINQDNTINELEDFYEYEIDLRPDAGRGIASSPYIVDKVEVAATDQRPQTTWYLFRVPIRNYTRKSSESENASFKSIRFMRLVTTDWEQPVVMRFATMQLVSNQYRVYANKIQDTTSSYQETPIDPLSKTVLKSTTVSIEENGCPTGVDCGDSKPYPYAVPPGFVRDVNYATQARMEFNEQALSLSVEKLDPKDSRGVFKNTDLNLNMYKRIKMFVHMHTEENNAENLGMFLRIGTDLKNNYYEVEIPRLRRSMRGETAPTLIWPEENEIDIPLEELRNLKLRRNKNSTTENFRQEYAEMVLVDGTASGTESPVMREYRLAVKGNPDLSKVMTIMIGVRNNSGEIKDFTIWTNELRASGFDTQDKGTAGLVSMDVKLADLGTLNLNGNFRNFGFGSVQDKISNRLQEDNYSYGGALNLALDKFLPMKWGLNIPFFVNYDKQVLVPGFNPLDRDIRLDVALQEDNLNPFQKNLTRDLVSDISTTTGFNFMNVHKVKGANATKNHFYDIENFSISYAQNRIYRSNILMANNDQSFTSAGLTYRYSPKGVQWEPFKKAARLDSTGLKFLRALSFAPIPSMVNFEMYNEQVFYRTKYRDRNLQDLPGENLIKYYYGNRNYDLQWNLTRSITLVYGARMQAILDDVDGQVTAEQDVKFGSRLFSKGRTKNYTQNIKATWRLPLQDIYALDWITANSTFDTKYGFRSVAFGQPTDGPAEYQFGHLLENGRDLGLDGRVDLVKLYNKVGYLRRANTPNAPRQRFTRAAGDDDEMAPEANKFAKAVTRLLMAARGINGRFALTETTTLPGFLEIPEFFGLSSANGGLAPGIPFVLGSQDPNKTIERAVENGWLSRNVQQYNPVIQTRGYTFDYSTNLEPIKDLRIIIKGNIARNNDLSYIYQPNEENNFEKFSPVRGGSFKMSFWSFKTSFKKVNSDPSSGYYYEPFANLQENRRKVLDIIEMRNPGIQLSENSQDVLIPAFFAAYTGRDVEDIMSKKKYTRKGSNTFNPFLGFPMPNWQINYGGIEKFVGLRSLFSNITLSHSFVSSYSVGNFTSNLMYSDLALLDYRASMGRGYTLGSELNSFTNLFDPVYIMSSIVMEEKFAPFLGVNFTTKGSFSGNFAWNKDRMALMNLSNAQVSETHGNDFVFGFGMKKNNVVLPLRTRDGNNIILPNDLVFRIDFTLRDLKMIQRKLDGDALIKSGFRTLQVRPNLQYTFNKRVSMTMYWEKMVNNPYVTQQYYTNNATFGVTARFNLAD